MLYAELLTKKNDFLRHMKRMQMVSVLILNLIYICALLKNIVDKLLLCPSLGVFYCWM